MRKAKLNPLYFAGFASSFLAIATLLTLFLRASNRAPLTESSVPVFYPHHVSENCETKIDLLKAGKLEIEDRLIGLSPDWSQGDYYLHSLRFLDCLILEGEQGNTESFELAKNVILNWHQENNFADKIDDWTWENNQGAWSEHGVAWRAVLLSYFYRVTQKVAPSDRTLIKTLQSVAKDHGQFLSASEPYMSDHNHGINNALGLLALGTAFRALPQAHEWIDLGLARAEQQMYENVSSDGIHLEQAGFYQFYTLRSFIELFKVAKSLDRPLSNEYQHKLDKMLEVGALMAGVTQRVEGVPWNNYDINMFEYMENSFPLNLGTSAPGKELFEKIKQGYSERGLFVKSEGGYSFFSGKFGQDLEITFHTRILAGPHAQPDALGITAALGNQRILSYGNYTRPSRKPKDFNIVLAEGLEPGDPLRLKSKPPLHERLIPKGGEVLASDSLPQLDFVTAQHQAYAGVTHTRTVARVGTRYLLVWDRIKADKTREFTQTFHFAVPIQLVAEGKKGVATLNGEPIAHYMQLEPNLAINICDTHSQTHELCSSELDDAGNRAPTPEINYTVEGQTAEFLWVLYVGTGPLEAQVDPADEGDLATKVVTLTRAEETYRIRLQGVNVSLD